MNDTDLYPADVAPTDQGSDYLPTLGRLMTALERNPGVFTDEALGRIANAAGAVARLAEAERRWRR